MFLFVHLYGLVRTYTVQYFTRAPYRRESGNRVASSFSTRRFFVIKLTHL